MNIRPWLFTSSKHPLVFFIKQPQLQRPVFFVVRKNRPLGVGPHILMKDWILVTGAVYIYIWYNMVYVGCIVNICMYIYIWHIKSISVCIHIVYMYLVIYIYLYYV